MYFRFECPNSGPDMLTFKVLTFPLQCPSSVNKMYAI